MEKEEEKRKKKKKKTKLSKLFYGVPMAMSDQSRTKAELLWILL